MKKLLWIGDAIASTGFAKSTHAICDFLDYRSNPQGTYEVHVLGINYYGDPHPYQYPIYPAWIPGGDAMGWGRTRGMVRELKPDLVVIQNDPWNVMGYLRDREGFTIDVPVVGYIAVDGKHCVGGELNLLALSVFWTEFARGEAKRGGHIGPSAVVPLGVDLTTFRPQDKATIRERMQMAKMFADRGASPDSFVVGCVGRNGWRKRLDLVIEYFAEWVTTRKIDDAFLWLHSAPTRDAAWDLDDLAEYYGVRDRVLIPKIPGDLYGLDEARMARCYAMMDVLFTATLGEGFWLPGFEAAACGTPIVAPDWSAVGELFRDAALLVPCTATCAHPNQVNVIGGVMDKAKAIESLDLMYRDADARERFGLAAFDRATESRFRWRNVGLAFAEALEGVLPRNESHEAAWQDLGRPEEPSVVV